MRLALSYQLLCVYCCLLRYVASVLELAFKVYYLENKILTLYKLSYLSYIL
jgi:hypothetical protein